MSSIAPSTVRASPLFAGLTEQEKDDLLKSGRERRFGRKETLFLHGDLITNFFIISSGTVQLFRETPDGHEKTLQILVPGNGISEREIFQSFTTHQLSASAVEETVVLEFPMSWLKDAAKKYTPLALNLLATISQYAEMAAIEVEHQSNMSATQQVACFLQRLCILHDFDPKGFTLPYSKTLIASRLGMELETFSRTLAKLKDYGITISGARVAITDLEGIQDYVCGTCSIADDCPTHKAMGEKVCGSSTQKIKRT